MTDCAELKEFCDIQSSTSNPAGVNALGHLLADKLAVLGFETECADLSAHGVGDFFTYRRMVASDAPAVVVMIHLDTVGQDIPYSDDGEYAYGSGALDMKGGIVVMLRALRQLDLNRHNTIVLAASDEERGSLYSRPHIEAALSQCQPERTIVLCMEFSGGELIVEQPGSHKWFAEFGRIQFEDFNEIAMRLRLLCQNGCRANPAIIQYHDERRIPPKMCLKMTFSSDGGHSGTREAMDGRDTHLAASLALASLDRIATFEVRMFAGGEYTNKIPDSTIVVIDILKGDRLEIIKWTQGRGISTEILSNNGHRFGSDKSMAGDMRYVSNEAQVGLFKQFTSILDGKWTNSHEPPRRPAFERNQQTVDFLDNIGLGHLAASNPTAADVNFVPGGFIAINGLGPTGDGAHSPHERALLKSFPERVMLFTQIASGFLDRSSTL